MKNTLSCRMWFGVVRIAAIHRQKGGSRGWNCSKGIWMTLSAWFVVTRTSTWKLHNSFHKNLPFTIEKVNMEGGLAFLNINVNVSSKSNITCHWYQEPTYRRKILNFSSYAQLQHKKNVIQGTVHRVFNATSDLLAFDQALEENRTCWIKNQHPDKWSPKKCEPVFNKGNN